MADEPKRVEENQDGTVIVRLHRPVTVGNEEYTRLQFRPAKAKEMPLLEKRNPSTQDILDLGNALCSSSGAVYELLVIDDVNLVVEAVGIQVGKFLNQQSGEGT